MTWPRRLTQKLGGPAAPALLGHEAFRILIPPLWVAVATCFCVHIGMTLEAEQRPPLVTFHIWFALGLCDACLSGFELKGDSGFPQSAVVVASVQGMTAVTICISSRIESVARRALRDRFDPAVRRGELRNASH